MRLLYIVTKGTDDTTLASVPLHIAANGSLEIGQEVSVVLAGDATDSFLIHRTTWRGPTRQLVCTIVIGSATHGSEDARGPSSAERANTTFGAVE
jgi:hypothetical protein